MSDTECGETHDCGDHDGGHTHGPDCGHEKVAHDDHEDYVVGDHLHHDHAGHCHDHGPASAA
jgi:hypothetical protein